MVVWSLGLGCRRDGADEWQVTALSRAPRHRRVVTIKCHPLPLTQAPRLCCRGPHALQRCPTTRRTNPQPGA